MSSASGFEAGTGTFFAGLEFGAAPALFALGAFLDNSATGFFAATFAFAFAFVFGAVGFAAPLFPLGAVTVFALAGAASALAFFFFNFGSDVLGFVALATPEEGRFNSLRNDCKSFCKAGSTGPSR